MPREYENPDSRKYQAQLDEFKSEMYCDNKRMEEYQRLEKSASKEEDKAYYRQEAQKVADEKQDTLDAWKENHGAYRQEWLDNGKEEANSPQKENENEYEYER